MQKLLNYFADGIESETLRTIGAEIETQFIDGKGHPITTETSQRMIAALTEDGWRAECRKGNLITELADSHGNRILYELGRHNIEISTAPSLPTDVLNAVRGCLVDLYRVGRQFDAEPYWEPILPGDDDLLVVPDERDAVWLELDGREALMPLARTSAVQFTLSVAAGDAIRILNRLGERIGSFLADYPQDAVWREYIRQSHAGYRQDRYGGPLAFNTLEDYCRSLAEHSVVSGARLVPFSEVIDLDIPLFLRSIWWYFRLKRYGNDLCVEIRPLPRRGDDAIGHQLEWVLSTIS